MSSSNTIHDAWGNLKVVVNVNNSHNVNNTDEFDVVVSHSLTIMSILISLPLECGCTLLDFLLK